MAPWRRKTREKGQDKNIGKVSYVFAVIANETSEQIKKKQGVHEHHHCWDFSHA